MRALVKENTRAHSAPVKSARSTRRGSGSRTSSSDKGEAGIRAVSADSLRTTLRKS